MFLILIVRNVMVPLLEIIKFGWGMVYEREDNESDFGYVGTKISYSNDSHCHWILIELWKQGTDVFSTVVLNKRVGVATAPRVEARDAAKYPPIHSQSSSTTDYQTPKVNTTQVQKP